MSDGGIIIGGRLNEDGSIFLTPRGSQTKDSGAITIGGEELPAGRILIGGASAEPLDDSPIITSVAPDPLEIGAEATVTGIRFGSSAGIIYIGTQEQTADIVWSDTGVSFTVHADTPTGIQQLRLVTDDYDLLYQVNVDAYSGLEDMAAPLVTLFINLPEYIDTWSTAYNVEEWTSYYNDAHKLSVGSPVAGEIMWNPVDRTVDVLTDTTNLGANEALINSFNAASSDLTIVMVGSIAEGSDPAEFVALDTEEPPAPFVKVEIGGIFVSIVQAAYTLDGTTRDAAVTPTGDGVYVARLRRDGLVSMTNSGGTSDSNDPTPDVAKVAASMLRVTSPGNMLKLKRFAIFDGILTNEEVDEVLAILAEEPNPVPAPPEEPTLEDIIDNGQVIEIWVAPEPNRTSVDVNGRVLSIEGLKAGYLLNGPANNTKKPTYDGTTWDITTAQGLLATAPFLEALTVADDIWMMIMMEPTVLENRRYTVNLESDATSFLSENLPNNSSLRFFCRGQLVTITNPALLPPADEMSILAISSQRGEKQLVYDIEGGTHESAGNGSNIGIGTFDPARCIVGNNANLTTNRGLSGKVQAIVFGSGALTPELYNMVRQVLMPSPVEITGYAPPLFEDVRLTGLVWNAVAVSNTDARTLTRIASVELQDGEAIDSILIVDGGIPEGCNLAFGSTYITQDGDELNCGANIYIDGLVDDDAGAYNVTLEVTTTNARVGTSEQIEFNVYTQFNPSWESLSSSFDVDTPYDWYEISAVQNDPRPTTIIKYNRDPGIRDFFTLGVRIHENPLDEDQWLLQASAYAEYTGEWTTDLFVFFPDPAVNGGLMFNTAISTVS